MMKAPSPDHHREAGPSVVPGPLDRFDGEAIYCGQPAVEDRFSDITKATCAKPQLDNAAGRLHAILVRVDEQLDDNRSILSSWRTALGTKSDIETALID